MPIRAVVSLTKVAASVDHSALAASVTHTAVVMDGMTLVHIPKNKIVNDVCTLDELTVFLVNKSLTDHLQTNDLKSITASKSASDLVAFTDSADRVFEKHHDDPVAMLDARAANFGKAAVDQAQLTDLSSLGVSLNKDSDEVGFVDQLSMRFVYYRNFYDAFGLDDYANINKDFVGSKGNIFGFSDLTAFTYQKPITDVVGHSDQHNIGTTLGKVDSLPTLDAAVIHSAKGVEDATGLTDLNIWNLSKPTTDAISASDLSSFELSKTPADGVATTDTFSREVEYARTPSETLSVSETADKELTTTKTDAFHTTDALTRTVSYNRNFYDVFGLDDYANVNKDFVGSKGNIFGFSDIIAFSSAKYLSDQASLADLPTLHTAHAKTDTFSTPDVSTLQVNKGRTDGVATTDTFSRSVEFQREFAETLVLQEQFTTGDKELNKQNAVGLSELASLSNRIIKVDTPTLLDATDVSTIKSTADSVAASDSFSRTVEFDRTASDSVTAADVFSPHFTKTANDSAALADVVTQTHIFNRAFADGFTLDDFSSVDKNLAGTKTNVFGFADIHACEVEKEVADSFGFLESVTVTRRSAAGFNTASFNNLLFN